MEVAKVIICETMLKPSIISVPSESKGDGTTYDVVSSTLFNDSLCTCPGFQFRGTCKHIRLAGNTRCSYHQITTREQIEAWIDGKNDNCPFCGSHLILYELDPEFD